MTIDRMVELLKIEHECMLRKSHGDCNGQCEDCELVQDDGALHEMYENVIGLVEGMETDEPKRPEINPNCHGLGYANCEICDSYCPYR